MSEKYVVTWDMFQMHARKLAERLLPATQWKGIIAVSRGGLFPAAVLARELNIRFVETVCIASYDHDEQGALKVLHRAEGDGEGTGYSGDGVRPAVAWPRKAGDQPSPGLVRSA